MPRVKIGAALPDRATLDVTELRSHWQVVFGRPAAHLARLLFGPATAAGDRWGRRGERGKEKGRGEGRGRRKGRTSEGVLPMKTGSTKVVRCAIYTRVSTDQGLEQDFNSLDAQYEASQAYIRSQAHAGWTLLRAK